MRRLLLIPVLFLCGLHPVSGQSSVNEVKEVSSQEPPAPPPPAGVPKLEPILAEAPANAPDLAPLPALTASGAPAKLSYSACNVEGPFVALTFDDGPHPQNTPRLLDMLKQRGVKATFFVVGQNAAEHPDILKRIAAEGHELANHSYTHPVLASKSEAALREELDKTHQAVLKSTGVTMKVMRPPYGALSEPQRRWTHANFGYRIILWDVDPLDWKYRDAARVQSEILAHTKAGSIILSHDIHKSTVDAMPETLDALASRGFKFVTVSEILAMDKPAPPKAPASNSKPVARGDVKADAKRSATDLKSKAKAPEKEVARKTESPATKTKTATKQVAMTQEELRSKWLEINKQR